jgi:SAM-dependent methyltransferase
VRNTLKMPIHAGTLADARFPDGAFDIVAMNEYLEHEPNPRELLVEARRISAKGGHLAIEIPFIEGLPAKLFGSRWSQVDAPRHMVYFTRATLSEMLRRCGYQLIHTQTFQIPYMIGVSVLQALGHRRLGRLSFTDRTLAMLAALPLLPMFPFLDEFMFAVARAE